MPDNDTSSVKSIKNKVIYLQKVVKECMVAVDTLSTRVDALPTLTEVNNLIDVLETAVDEWSDRIEDVESKLTKVQLPETTRYYLDEDELSNWQAMINDMRITLAQLSQSKQSFVALANRFDMTR